MLLIASGAGEPVRFLASLYSFGVLIAFTAAQVAVVRLRFTEPELERPFRVPGNVRIKETEVPVAALVGAPLTFAIWLIAIATHDAARIAGPVWIAFGLVVYTRSRIVAHERVLGRVTPREGDLVPEIEGAYQRILVPMKIGIIGEEVLGTALRLAEEQRCSVLALHVIRVPLDQPLDAELIDAEEQAEASLAEAQLLAAEQGIPDRGADRPLARDRRDGRRGSRRARRRPDRHGLVAALAAPVAFLQPHGRIRAPQGPVRGDGDRLSAGCSGGGRRASWSRRRV